MADVREKDLVTATVGLKRENKTKGPLTWPLWSLMSIVELLATDIIQELCDLG